MMQHFEDCIWSASWSYDLKFNVVTIWSSFVKGCCRQWSRHQEHVQVCSVNHISICSICMKFEVNYSMQFIQSAINEGPCRHSSRWFGGGYVMKQSANFEVKCLKIVASFCRFWSMTIACLKHFREVWSRLFEGLILFRAFAFQSEDAWDASLSYVLKLFC